MLSENELKKQADMLKKMQDNSGATCGSTLGLANDAYAPLRTSIRDRVEDQIRDTNRKLRKAEQMQELAILLDKNPEILRILDLLEHLYD